MCRLIKSEPLQAAVWAALLGGGTTLLITAPFGLHFVTLPAVSAAFVATWAVWVMCYRGTDASGGSAIVVGLLSVVLAVILMWLQIGLFEWVSSRDLSIITSLPSLTAITLLYVGLVILPVGATATYIIRNRQIERRPREASTAETQKL